MITYSKQNVKSKTAKNTTLSILNNLQSDIMYTLPINPSNIAFLPEKCYNLTENCDWRNRFMLHIYTGSGKGKTTAAVGLAVRAAGAGLRVCFFQLMKDGSSSEIAMLERLGVKVAAARSCCKFSFEMSEAERAAAKAEHDAMLTRAAELLRSGGADLIVLDEFFCALSEGLVSSGPAGSLVAGGYDAELVLTGRGACAPYTDAADYVTEMVPHKHPYDKGVQARKGIEY